MSKQKKENTNISIRLKKGISCLFKLNLSWRRPISYRNQFIDLLCKSMDWFLYDIGLRHERVKSFSKYFCSYCLKKAISHKKTTVIGIIFNLEKLKRRSRCVDLEESFNKYLHI